MAKSKYNAIKNHNPREGHFHEVFGLTCERGQELLDQTRAFSIASRVSAKSKIFEIIANLAKDDSEYTFLISEVSTMFALEAVELAHKAARNDKEANKLQVKDLDLSDIKKEKPLPN